MSDKFRSQMAPNLVPKKKRAPAVKAKLTARTVTAVTPKDKRYKVWDTELIGFFLRVLPTGTKTYYIFYRHNGVAKEYSIGRHGKITTDQARKIAKIKLGEIAQGVDIQTDKKKAVRLEAIKKFQTLGGFISNRYQPWVLAERTTGRATIANLKHEFAYLYPKKMVNLGQWEIDAWRKKARIDRDVKNSTLNRQLVSLKAVLSKAVSWGILHEHPLAKVKPLKIDTKGNIRFLSEVEEQRLRAAMIERETDLIAERKSANQWRKQRNKERLADLSSQTFVDYLRPMVLLAMNTGMRRGELFNLTWQNIDFKKRNLTIEGHAAKSGMTRHLPLNDEALGTLIAWRNDGESHALVFPNPKTRKRFTNIKNSWETLHDKAKLKEFRFHDLRHHFASRLVMQGVELNTVRELLGHSDIQMTLRYAHLAPEHTAAAVAKLDTDGK